MPRWCRRLINVGLFLAGLGTVVTVSHSLVPQVGITARLRKAAGLRHIERCPSVVFFGSSRTFRSVIPAEFDAHCEQLGLETYSLNHGLRGATDLEMVLVARRAVADRPRIRVAVVEVGCSQVGIPAGERITTRVIQRHSSLGLRIALTTLWRSGLSVSSKWVALGDHLLHAGHFFFRVGKGLEWWARLGFDERKLASAAINQNRGYSKQVLGRKKLLDERKRIFEATAHEFEWLVQVDWEASKSHLRASHATAWDARIWADIELLTDLQDELEGQGVRTVFVVYPDGHPRPIIDDLVRTSRLRRVVHLNDPGRFPELFATPHRFDVGHLNEAGARIATRILAEQVVSLLGVELSGNDVDEK